MVGSPASDYADQLHDSGLRNLITGGIWPTPSVTPEELETESVPPGSTDEILRFVGTIIDEARRRRE
jgi:hypothetical protein